MFRYVLTFTLVAAVAAVVHWANKLPEWTPAELLQIQSLSLDSLEALPPDPVNAVADSLEAARFGQQLFFDTRLSESGTIACSTCHQPVRYFTDGLPKGVALGVSKRNTPTIVGTAYSPWLYWDGRKDSQWSQALSPLEDRNEHRSSRDDVARVVREDRDYRTRYENLFGSVDHDTDRLFSNIGKALAAYERRLTPGQSRFDDYANHLAAGGHSIQQGILSAEEIRGLRIFIGEGRCTECHNGPLLTNNEFHNTGVLSAVNELPDRGRIDGIRLLLDDPFNCLGLFSDDNRCAEVRFARQGPELTGAMRTPGLRSVAMTAPYMHKGQIDSLAAVIDHYNRAPDAMIGHNEAKPLGLSRRDIRNLIAFLHTLTAEPGTDPEWLEAP